jgi:rhodanese-related sulfurtransferase
MRHKFLFSLLALVTTAGLIACNAIDQVAKNQNKPQLGPETTYADGARRVTIDELETLMKNNQAVVIDVRSQAAFDQGHIPGSKLIPAGEIVNHISELPRDKMIVTYCSWQNEHTSAGAVVALKAKGINNAAALLGGFNLWQQEKKPIDKK